MTFGRGTLKFQWYASYLLMYKKKHDSTTNLLEKRSTWTVFQHFRNPSNKPRPRTPKEKSRGKSLPGGLIFNTKSLCNPGASVLFGGIPRFELPEHVFFFVGVSYPPGKSQVFQRIWDLTVFDFSGGMPPSPSTWPVRKVQVKSLKHAQLKFWGSHREIPGYTRKHMGVPVFKNKSHSECKICWSNSNISPKMKKSDNLWNHHLASWTT